MTSLLLAGETPLPPNSGTRLRTVHLARALAAELPVELAVLGPAGEADGEPYAVTAVPHKRSRLGALVRAIGRPYGAAKASSPRLAALARERRPAVAAQAQALWVLPAARAAGCPVVLDAHNVESDLLRRLAGEARNPAHRLRWRWEAGKTAAWERRGAAAVDVVCVTSDLDGAFFERAGARAVLVVPNGVDVRAVPWSAPVPGRTLVYVGHYGYQPNAAAALELADEVLPRVRAAVPAAELRLVGRDPTPAMRARPVDVTGMVPDVLPYLHAARVMVVPLRSGSGTRLKVLEALAAGVPVVSTPLGIEGLDLRDGEHLLVGDGSADLAALAVRLIEDDALAARLSAAGRAHVERTYDWPALARPLVELHLRIHEGGRP